MKHFIDGDQAAVTKDDFVNLQESPAVFIPLDSELGKLINEKGLHYADIYDQELLSDMLDREQFVWPPAYYSMDKGDHDNDADSVCYERDEYRQQRDELLAACEMAVQDEYMSRGSEHGGLSDETYTALQAAIARCKGESDE